MNNLLIQEFSRGLLIKDINCLTALSNSEITSFTHDQVDTVFIVGTMTRYGYYGAYAIAAKINACKSNCIVLNIDSGGGTIDSIPIIVQAIKDARANNKTVIANVASCCSAAYWVASACDYIYADSELSIIGSIGVMVQHVDYTKYLEDQGISIKHIYASKSADKNGEYREAQKGNFEPYELSLDKVVDVFIEHIKTNRKDVNPSCFTGKIYSAKEAIELGLIDAIIPFKTCLTFKTKK